jgi:hypothetical protein
MALSSVAIFGGIHGREDTNAILADGKVGTRWIGLQMPTLLSNRLGNWQLKKLNCIVIGCLWSPNIPGSVCILFTF